MTTEIPALLAQLRLDHRNVALLLKLLDDELDRVLGTTEPDFELAHDIMRYMTVYADAVHHPKEDVLYANLHDAQPELTQHLQRVEGDHVEIGALGLALRNDLEAIVAGAAVRRERLIKDARHYASRLRQHMVWEDEELFRRADEMADEGIVLTIDVSRFRMQDPLFGSRRERSFRNLFESIQRTAAFRA